VVVRWDGGGGGGDKDICSTSIGVVGDTGASWDTHFYLDTDDRANRLRRLAATTCGFEYESLGSSSSGGGGGGGGGGKGRKKRVMLYNRDKTRRLLGSNVVVEDLQILLGEEWVVEEVIHSDHRPVCELLLQLSTADVMLTPHGFQSIMLLFLHPGAMLIEVFPHSFDWIGYNRIAPGVGIKHVRLESDYVGWREALVGKAWEVVTDDCSHVYLCRFAAKKNSVSMNQGQIEETASIIKTYFA